MKPRVWIILFGALQILGTSKAIPSCNPNPCLNDAPCERTVLGFYQCRCSSQYIGEYCQTVNPCLNAVCMNNATCRIITLTNQQFSTECVCQPGFNGTQCEHISTASVCYNSPCRHGGTCVNTNAHDLSQYRCDCNIGYMGLNCEIIDHCVTQPCSNGGVCTSHSGGYSCTCKSGFSGATCKQDINECAENPNLCQNGGVCENQHGSYFCNCPVTYRGQLCEQPYVPCYPDPCQNGGVCLTTSATTYQCTCPSGKIYLRLKSQFCPQTSRNLQDYLTLSVSVKNWSIL